MAIELNAYEVECPECHHFVEFTVKEVPDLAGDINADCEEAARIAEREIEGQYAGMVDPDDLPIQPRTIHDLSAAIERGDKFEARLLLDRIAEDLGLEHKEAVQIGRYLRT